MSTRDTPDKKLAALLLQEIQCASTLLEYLQKESTELASNNPTPEPAGSAGKLQLINAMQRATQVRMDQMADMGLVLERGRLTDTAEAMDENNNLQPLFSQLAKLARQCFEENRLIGQLINRRTQFVTRMLDSLAPQTRNQHAETYGENGGTSSGPTNGLVDLAQ